MMLNKKAVTFDKLSQLDQDMSLRGKLVARSRGTENRRNAKLSFADPKGKRSAVNLLNYAKTKKAAMFGLDARIALAIFGALSVIIGAALYSALNKASVTALITELMEFGKAGDQYFLDTRRELPVVNVGGYLIYQEVQKLTSDTAKGWKGPYIGFPVVANIILDHPTYGNVFLQELKDGAWSAETEAAWMAANCVSGSVTGNCVVWTGVDFIDIEMIKAIDKQIDNSDGGKMGRVRYFKTVRGEWQVLIKYRISQRYS